MRCPGAYLVSAPPNLKLVSMSLISVALYRFFHSHRLFSCLRSHGIAVVFADLRRGLKILHSIAKVGNCSKSISYMLTSCEGLRNNFGWVERCCHLGMRCRGSRRCIRM